MLITLGARTETSDDALGMLAACHGRIRKFIGLAQVLGERPLPPAEALEVASQVERYFRIAFPLHVQDEEELLLPRLRGREVALDAALARMRSEHPILDAQVAEVVARMQDIATEGALTDVQRAALSALAPPLSAALEAHLAHEEQVLFPAAVRLLDPQQRQSLREEMRARRQPR